MKFEPVDREGIKNLFIRIDNELKNLQKKVTITLLGGVAIIMQGIRDRATLDFDVAPTKDALLFKKICENINIQVDIVTVASTVDIVHAEASIIYQGKYLVARVILPKDLLRLKLERFFKQDPEDIYAIINYLSLPYEAFKEIILDILPDYIGNARTLLLSALQVVQVKYHSHEKEFESEFL